MQLALQDLSTMAHQKQSKTSSGHSELLSHGIYAQGKLRTIKPIPGQVLAEQSY